MAKSAIARFKRRRRRRPRDAGDAPRARRSNGAAGEILSQVGPAFGAYAATKLLSRIVFVIVSKRWPRFAKPAAALSGLAAFAAAFWGAGRWKRLAPYQGPLLIGAGVAAAGGIARYIPKYGWIVTDPSAADAPAQPIEAAAQAAAAEAAAGRDEYSYLEDEVAAQGSAPASMGVPERTAAAEPNLTAEEQAAYQSAALDVQDGDTDPFADYYAGSFAN